MKHFLAILFHNPYDFIAQFKRWYSRRPLVSPKSDSERLQNLSRALYGDDRLLR